MDPVTAIGLVSAVLQVVNCSVKVVERCQELYKDGTLAEQKTTKELTQQLSKLRKAQSSSLIYSAQLTCSSADTTEGLKASIDQAPKPTSRDDADILDIATKYSTTARTLLAELPKLKLQADRSLTQVVSKDWRAFRRKAFLNEVQAKLAEYQRILDTRILKQLRFQSLQQTENFQGLDQNVQRLIVAMNQGHTTIEQLLVNQSQVLREIDRRMDNYEKAKSNLITKQKFKESLFSPEILSRQEQIPREYQGTCRWIFHPQRSKAVRYEHHRDANTNEDLAYHSSQTDGEVLKESDGTASENDSSWDDDSDCEDMQDQPWSNFVDWLEHGQGVCKAGSGKSTLMSYSWANGSDHLTGRVLFLESGHNPSKKYSRVVTISLVPDHPLA